MYKKESRLSMRFTRDDKTEPLMRLGGTGELSYPDNTESSVSTTTTAPQTAHFDPSPPLALSCSSVAQCRCSVLLLITVHLQVRRG